MEIIRDMWFLHDGAPPHFRLDVRNFLNNEFPERWIGRGAPDPRCWLPRSPDCTPLDFFLWGHVKALVYENVVPASVEELKERIVSAFDSIRAMPGIFSRVRQSMISRIEACVISEGQHFEHLL